MLVRIRPGLDFYKIETMEDYKQMPGMKHSRAGVSFVDLDTSMSPDILTLFSKLGEKKKKTLTCQEQIETLPSRVIIIQSFRITQYHTIIQFTGKQIVTVKYTAIK